MPIWPFQRSRAQQDASRLLSAVQTASRNPAFFGDGRVPDTLEGRFELVALNGALALIRLRAELGAESLAQDFTDQFFRQIDAGLRESGVGDLAVPKRMQKLAGAFYGRLQAYADALAAGDGAGLGQALARNALGPEDHPFAAALSTYALNTARSQSTAPLAALFDAEGWPAPAG